MKPKKHKGTGVGRETDGAYTLHIMGESVCSWDNEPAQEQIIFQAFYYGQEVRAKAIRKLI